MTKLWVLYLLFVSIGLQAQSIPYESVTITQITSQDPAGPWAISGHVAVTGYVMVFAPQADGDVHVPFCDSPNFVVPSSGSSLPDKTHCVMAELTPYLRCSFISPLPSLQTVKGLLRFDGGSSAGWWEIHPIESMTGTSCFLRVMAGLGVAGAGDFNGDGKGDILWRNSSTGTIALWLMNGNTVISSLWVGAISDPNWQIVGNRRLQRRRQGRHSLAQH